MCPTLGFLQHVFIKDRGTRERIVNETVGYALSHWVLQDVSCCMLEILFAPQDVIVEPSLPQPSTPTSLPIGARGLSLVGLYKRGDIFTLSWAKEKVNMVRHEAIGVEDNIQTLGRQGQHVDKCTCEIGVGQKWFPPESSPRNMVSVRRVVIKGGKAQRATFTVGFVLTCFPSHEISPRLRGCKVKRQNTTPRSLGSVDHKNT